MYSVCPLLGVTSRDGKTGISDEPYIRAGWGYLTWLMISVLPSVLRCSAYPCLDALVVHISCSTQREYSDVGYMGPSYIV